MSEPTPEHQRYAFTSQQGWVPHKKAAISIDDYGFMQGATIVDRMRTCAGTLLDFSLHYQRFLHSCDAIGIPTDSFEQDAFERLANECVSRNRDVFNEQDFSVAMVATPGAIGGNESPTLVVNSSPIDWRKLDHWYRRGQALSISAHRNVPSECWSPKIKTRSRLQYFLSDQAVNTPFGGAVLLSIANELTETSVANLLILEGENLIAPLSETVLPGISLARTTRLAEADGIVVRYEPISVERAKRATGILLTGTVGCLWHCSSLGGIALNSDARCTTVLNRLKSLWSSEIGINYVEQASMLSQQQA